MNKKEIEKGAVLKVWLEGDEIPFGFREGVFSVDIERRYLEVQRKDGSVTGMFFSMFDYDRNYDENAENEEVEARGYN